mmetsp:Transcript_20631/g.33976  ORF Transcript_20631/g.33976 Transcript_20631/m.33976 type:complete len:288 (+) Transcript_20631:71-934(+)
MNIKPRVSEFSSADVPLDEITAFYSLVGSHVPNDRPYAWSMTVSSLDGVIAFLEENSSPQQVALSHIRDSGGAADWRLLNAGWAHADAVLGTGEILRSEPEVLWIPRFEDLLTYRRDVLKKEKPPLNVVLTASGLINVMHPMLTVGKPCRTLIITTAKGKDEIEKARSKMPDPALFDAEIVCLSDGDQVPFKDALHYLRTKENVHFLDVTAGGKVISALVHDKLLDEVRLTIAGQLVGRSSSLGLERPSMFQGHSYGPNNSPLVNNIGIRVYGNHHLFLRGLLQYRH